MADEKKQGVAAKAAPTAPAKDLIDDASKAVAMSKTGLDGSEATTEDMSAAQRILALERANAELQEKLKLSQEHINKVDPEVLVRYKGKRKDFVFWGYDFSKGTCKMLKSESVKLITHDPYCFGLA